MVTGICKKKMARTVAIHATVRKLSIRNMSASVAWQRKSFQLVVGAARQRAAPRSQSYGAARVALCHSSVSVGRSTSTT